MKRVLDLSVSAFAILLLSPLLIVLSILIVINLGSPIFFFQKRPGKGEKVFKMIKFRSMNNKCNHDGHLLPNNLRLTKFGKWLRSYSLDELPELFNVLLGDMSLVGPRPLRVHYLSYYSKEQRLRHDVKPGITGWAQINGRNGIDWDEKLSLDVWYVKNKTFWLDIKILWLTVFKTIKREGITDTNGQFVMPFDEYVKKKTRN